MAGGLNDWKTLIDHQSWLLTETKNLVGQQKEILIESKAQSKQNKWTITIAILALLASIVLPFITD